MRIVKSINRTLPLLRRVRILTAVWVYAAVALLVLGPLLLPGYILTLDMVFTPELRMPAQVTSSYVFRVLLHVLDLALPADLIQKLMLFSILLLSGYGMHRLVKHMMGPVERAKAGWLDIVTVRGTAAARSAVPQTMVLYFAGLLYMVNPFTYGRLMAGQYAVLFGYALLPWLARSVVVFAARPGWKPALALAGWAVVVSIVSIHSIGPAMILAALVLALQFWRQRRVRDSPGRQWRLARYAAVTATAWLAASSYWLVPALAGASPTAQTVAGFTGGDRQAFATTGSNAAERIGNVLGLQGFWGEGHGLYIMPQYAGMTPQWLWIGLALVLLGLVVTGAVSGWRHSRRGEVAVFGGCVVAGAVLAAGVGGEWLAVHVPFYAGYREPHKFAMLVALGYGVLSAAGFVAVVRMLGKRQSMQPWAGAVAGLLLALPVALTPTMVWGAKGQLQAVQYPEGWYAVNERLNDDADDFRTLFLPWHMYMHMDFAGRLIANPARNFFDKPVVISDNPELDGAALDRSSPATRRITGALAVAGDNDRSLGATLADLDVKYIILAKDNDYLTYDYLDKQANLTRVADYPAMSLYRNEAYTPERN